MQAESRLLEAIVVLGFNSSYCGKSLEDGE